FTQPDEWPTREMDRLPGLQDGDRLAAAEAGTERLDPGVKTIQAFRQIGPGRQRAAEIRELPETLVEERPCGAPMRLTLDRSVELKARPSARTIGARRRRHRREHRAQWPDHALHHPDRCRDQG